MIQKPKRSFVIYTLLSVAVAAMALIVAGFWACESLSIAVAQLQRIQIAQSEAQSALSLQLREDAALQEFDRFRRRYFYDPQFAALEPSRLQLAESAAVACCGHKGDRSYSKAERIVMAWTKQIAGPIIAHPRSTSGSRSLLVATYDKILIDEYSGKLGTIDGLLSVEAEHATGDVRQAIDRLVYIFAALVVVFVTATICCRIAAVA